jgi:hypothetical protein
MDWTAKLDLYCERTGPGLFSEPVNALTNVAFFIAAWLLWRDARRRGVLSGEVQLLVWLIVAIGIGSALFHTFATRWAHLLDNTPILAFQLAFLWLYARRALGWRQVAAAALAAAFLLAALYARQFPSFASGSITYAPALVALALLGTYHRVARRAGAWLLLAAAGVFTLSLALRTVDEAACPWLPLGTHFFWHLLNAVVLYLCVRALPVARKTME